MDIQILGT